MSAPAASPPSAPQRRLSTFDCMSIVVGIVVGSGIYQSLGMVAAQATTAGELAGLWIAGGVFALVGSLCYAELATRYPEEGGDYVYLNRAYGRGVGFLFAWTQLWIIRPGSIGALACVFAEYATELLPLGPSSFVVYACGSIALLTLLNMLGVRQSTRAQNVLTTAKILGLATLVVAGLLGASAAPAEAIAASSVAAASKNPAQAMIFVLFAYSGWNEMGCVAAEVRDPRRNIWRALLGGSAIVTLVYLGVNAACLHLLSLEGMAGGQAVAAAAATQALGAWGAKGLSVLICISALGSTNGMIFTGARIYYAMGKQRRLFAPLAVWHPRFGTPLVSLAVQAVVSLGLLVGFGGLASGDTAGNAFERLVIFMTPPFYMFLVLSAGAVVIFRLRAKKEKPGQEPPSEETYRMPLFPLPPLIVALAGAFMTYQGVEWIRFNFATQGADLKWPTIWVGATAAGGLAIAVWEKVRGRGRA